MGGRKARAAKVRCGGANMSHGTLAWGTDYTSFDSRWRRSLEQSGWKNPVNVARSHCVYVAKPGPGNWNISGCYGLNNSRTKNPSFPRHRPKMRLRSGT
ncbi:hypothetical protein M404DRAFT_501880 [Pisolithus tinctorius Marx 270]|uniref:Uncharacterized protein n=1 Tax=Pisolithus tinctorius Marx 270 TaxID=870435 RepID=A0A0C3NCG3_PISTI|nr:hypothetical protein M404DRAFT_501880 [Pisolithus tinctorius Marx 270]